MLAAVQRRGVVPNAGGRCLGWRGGRVIPLILTVVSTEGKEAKKRIKERSPVRKAETGPFPSRQGHGGPSA
jgi:hypothetical protein